MKTQILKFINNYVANGCKDSTAAAIAAGYSQKTAYSQASRLLKTVEVQGAVQRVLAEQEMRTLINRDKVLIELGRIALCDLGAAFDANGNILPIKDMPEDVRRAISSIEVESLPSIINKDGEADGEGGTVTKIKFWDKVKALELIGKYFKLFTDRVEISDITDRAALLAEARKRADEMKDAKPDADGEA